MKTLPLLVSLASAGLAAGAAAAEDCEALRARIETRITAAGVAQFSVSIVEATAPAEGQVVGSCELGSKKIVYRRSGGNRVEPASAPRAPGGERILTECKDGTVTVGGSCRQ